MMALGLYYHIPYCGSKCRYCDFYSRGGQRAVPEAYVQALLRHLEQYTGGAPLRPSTVYFGGGTPSLLSPAQVKALLLAAQPRPGAEVTLEANPDTLTPESLRGYRKAGVNRLSLGVQTARDGQLRILGRLHTAESARRALAMAREAGFENLSGDIMLALPGYTTDEFDETLALLQEGGAVHISAYLLKIEPGTAFARRPPEDLPDPDAAADFYLYAVRRLEEAGYIQYEISNFARPGFEGRHNLLYWHCEDYLGLGPAAHSCVNGQRFYIPADTDAFIAGEAPFAPDGLCTAADRLMLGLRLREGVDLPAWEALNGAPLDAGKRAFIRQLCDHGYARFDGRTLALTPAGLLVQNSILTELL